MTTQDQSIDLKELEGRWYILQTNFPMWLKGDKINPTFNYSIDVKSGKPILLDSVRYQKKGKQRSIEGKDYPLNIANSDFVWRGNGLLGLLKSEWSILHFDTVHQWALIKFKKTLFTPEGYDVICKSKSLNAEALKEVNKLLADLGISLHQL
ncbi:hypothetical protein [Jiulongibacter sp. NS-SX5]|uniref:hypothetical protein n=1 Tax=Jiulongibacter sp. NS-SX5 TaxID=3463854 RepID=UPI004059DEA3